MGLFPLCLPPHKSHKALYFMTICSANKEHIFSKNYSSPMLLSDSYSTSVTLNHCKSKERPNSTHWIMLFAFLNCFRSYHQKLWQLCNTRNIRTFSSVIKTVEVFYISRINSSHTQIYIFGIKDKNSRTQRKTWSTNPKCSLHLQVNCCCQTIPKVCTHTLFMRWEQCELRPDGE